MEKGGAAATILWDLESFFETVDRQKLYKRAGETSFPLPALRLALGVYSSPRVLALGGRLAREIWPTRGVGAGCGMACTLVKVYCLAAMDDLVKRLPETSYGGPSCR